jgi:hypothetical protein
LGLTRNGIRKTPQELVEGTREIVRQKIGATLFDANEARILIAVCVHSLESWLLLILFNIDEPNNSFDRLNRQLAAAKRRKLTKSYSEYLRICGDIRLKRVKSSLHILAA